LLAFVIVSVGVLVLRIQNPGLKPRFRTPAVWLVAPLGALSSLYLMISLPWPTWERLIVWFALGMILYFGYGIYHSRLGKGAPAGETGWSRALKFAGLAWIILGTLAAVLWLANYRQEHLPGIAGWFWGIVGWVFALTLGVVLNFAAQQADQLRARPTPPS
jgi:hypothetical protein